MGAVGFFTGVTVVPENLGFVHVQAGNVCVAGTLSVAFQEAAVAEAALEHVPVPSRLRIEVLVAVTVDVLRGFSVYDRVLSKLV